MNRIMTKRTKWHVRPAKTDQPGHPPSLIRVFAVRSIGSYKDPSFFMRTAKTLIRLGGCPTSPWIWNDQTIGYETTSLGTKRLGYEITIICFCCLTIIYVAICCGRMRRLNFLTCVWVWKLPFKGKEHNKTNKIWIKVFGKLHILMQTA